MDVDAVIAEVAGAVGLAEGPAGVADVLRVIVRHEPVAAREIGRRAELPVPIVVAVCNELRKRGMVDRGRKMGVTHPSRGNLNRNNNPGTRPPATPTTAVRRRPAVVDPHEPGWVKGHARCEPLLNRVSVHDR